MKNLRKSVTALALSACLLASTGNVFAHTTDNNDLVTIEKTSTIEHQLNNVTDSKKIALGVLLQEEQRVKLSITNGDGELVYASSYKASKGFMQTFDFSKLEDATYTFKIEAGTEVVESNVVVKNSAAVMPEFSAYISEVEDSKVKFSYFAPSEDVYLVLSNAEGKVLFEKKVGAGYNSSGIANLSKLEKGTYSLKIKNGSHTESKEITI